MDKEQFKRLIRIREETDDEWQAGVEKSYNAIIDFICDDTSGFIEYLLTECTASEFSWLSEIFDLTVLRISDNSLRREFVDALKYLSKKYDNETRVYNIIPFIESAENLITT